VGQDQEMSCCPQVLPVRSILRSCGSRSGNVLLSSSTSSEIGRRIRIGEKYSFPVIFWVKDQDQGQGKGSSLVVHDSRIKNRDHG